MVRWFSRTEPRPTALRHHQTSGGDSLPGDGAPRPATSRPPTASQDVLAAMGRPAVLWAAWARVAAGSGMPGADGLSVADFARQLGIRLDRLADQLTAGAYEPQPLRLATINRGGRRRALGLPTVRDRIAQRAFLEVCHDQLDAASVEVSFAYRRGRSWLDALAEAERCRDTGRTTVLRTDVADYFACIRHDLLLAALPPGLAGEAATLIDRWIAAPLLTEHGIIPRSKGIPEGAPLSPALANLHLRAFDTHVHHNPGNLVRYADDIAVFCVDVDGAIAAAHIVGRALADLDLEMNTTKTYISSFDRGFSFLGWVFYRDGGWEAEPTAGWTHPMSVGRQRRTTQPDPAAYTGPQETFARTTAYRRAR
ncbi:reverse transcriptase domain-containing protein [Frankia sp. Cr2]|uniref:reverse transcriptase domain-containing protein n=1 Tax=Frankia sp. Cr2 TaxID=3073932 RepID=UPI002AD23519|nr:reverse transcriptase domain-containing protein [Frankia sp. Cr2]